MVHAALQCITDAFLGDTRPNMAEGLVNEAGLELGRDSSDVVVLLLELPVLVQLASEVNERVALFCIGHR